MGSKQSAFRTLLRLLFLMILLPFVGASLVAIWVGNEQLKSEGRDLLRSEAETAMQRFNDIIDHSEGFVALLSVLDPESETCSKALSAVQPPFTDVYLVVAVADQAGRLVCAHPASAIGIDISDRPWFLEATETGKLAVGGFQVSRASGKPDLVLARPSPFGPGEGTYYVGASIDLEFLSQYIAGSGGGASGGIVIVDEAERILATTSASLELGAKFATPDTEGFSSTQVAGSDRDVFLTRFEIGGTQFKILALEQETGILTVPERMVISLVFFALLLGLSAAVYGYRRLQRDVIAPIHNLREAATRIAAGESGEVPRAPNAPLELGQALSAFNDMARKLELTSLELDRASTMVGLGIWRLRSGADSFWLSKNVRDILGFSEEVVRVEDFDARILEEDLPAVKKALTRVVEHNETAEVEYRIRSGTGDTRIFRAQAGPIVQGDAQMTGIVQDITELRRREAALERSQGLLRVARRAARLGGWRYDTILRRFVEFTENGEIQRMSAEEALDSFEGEDSARIQTAFWACVAGGVPFDEIVKHRSESGQEHWVRVIGEAEHNEAGEVTLVHGALQDVDEMVRARETSAEMQALLQGILDFLGDGFLVQDFAGRVRYINWRAQVMFGLVEKQGLLGHLLKEEVEPSLAAALRELSQRVHAEGANQSQSQVVRAEATDKWLELNVHATPSGVAIHVRDVTRDRERQARLRLLEAAIARLNDMIVITNADSISLPDGPEIVFVNDAFVEMTGYARSEVIGKTPRILQGEATERDRLDKVRQALETRRPVRTELTNYRKDGSVITLEIDIAPILNEKGNCTHFVAVQRDTTERREAEELLRNREEQFRLVSLASNDVIWDWNFQTGKIWRSDNYKEFFGPEPIEPYKISSFLELIHPDDRLRFTKSLNKALDGDASAWSLEYRIEAAGGTYRQVMDRGFILRHEDGSPRRMVGAMSDVTEIRNLDAQLHQVQKLESIGQLTGGVAHDFNNLLTIILGNCDLLLEEIEDEALKAQLHSINYAAERGAKLASSLLAYSRRQHLQPQPTNIDEMIKGAWDLFRQAVPERIAFDCELSGKNAVSEVDRDKLQSALLNIVINAVAAIERDGKIVIRTGIKHSSEISAAAHECPPGEFVFLEVVDDGSGMSPTVAERAFEPFFTTKEVGAGTGLGLSSVYGLVRQSGGTVELDTAPGKGTRVTLCFPLYDGQVLEDPVRDSVAPADPASGGGRQILIVEDDPDLRRFAVKCLSSVGYEVDEARTGDEALDMFKSNKQFDLLLTDVVVPGSTTGIELARVAHERQPDLAIVIMSGYADDLLKGDTDLDGNVVRLGKPFRAAELVETVSEALGG